MVERLAAGERVDPGRASAASTASAEPARARSAPRSALRRWANAASTTAKTCSRVARGRRRLAAGPGDQAGVDVGRRPEDVAPDRAGPAYVGVPGGLDRRDAVHLGAGPAASRSATSACTITSPCSQRGQQRQQVQQHRHRDVVGQVGDQRGRRRAGQRRSTRSASACTTSKRSALARGVRRDRVGQQRGELLVDLDRDHPAATSSRARVSEPSPGPTSSTTSSAVMPDSRTIRRTVLASMTKFCPRCLVGRRSSRRRANARPPGRGVSDRRRQRQRVTVGRQAWPKRRGSGPLTGAGRATASSPARRRSHRSRRGPSRRPRSGSRGSAGAGSPGRRSACQVPRLNCRPP